MAAAVLALAEAVTEKRHGRKEAIASQPAPLRSDRFPALPQDHVERRAAAYLDRIPPAISGSGGHSQTYTAATAMVHGFGLDAETAFRTFFGLVARFLFGLGFALLAAVVLVGVPEGQRGYLGPAVWALLGGSLLMMGASVGGVSRGNWWMVLLADLAIFGAVVGGLVALAEAVSRGH